MANELKLNCYLLATDNRKANFSAAPLTTSFDWSGNKWISAVQEVSNSYATLCDTFANPYLFYGINVGDDDIALSFDSGATTTAILASGLPIILPLSRAYDTSKISVKAVGTGAAYLEFLILDNAALPPPVTPEQAVRVSPSSIATPDPSADITLTWSCAAPYTGFDVIVNSANVSANQSGLSYLIAANTLSYETETTWQINTLNDTAKTFGNVWSFTTSAETEAPATPEQAARVSPLSTDRPDHTADITLTWTCNAPYTGFDVYLNSSKVSANQAGLTYLIAANTFGYSASTSWKIDTLNDTAKTVGNVWSFTTSAAPTGLPNQLLVSGAGSEDANGIYTWVSGWDVAGWYNPSSFTGAFVKDNTVAQYAGQYAIVSHSAFYGKWTITSAAAVDLYKCNSAIDPTDFYYIEEGVNGAANAPTVTAYS